MNKSSIQLSSKSELISAIHSAISGHNGLAIGKLGFSEQLTLLFHILSSQSTNPKTDPALRPLYLALKYHAEYQTGIFPTDIDFLIEYASFYTNLVCQADYLGLFNGVNEPKLVNALPFQARFINYLDTEPDRSKQYQADQCYLPALQNQRILIIAPFASFAKERAKQHTFELVWKNIGCRWFAPISIEAIDIPYSFLGQSTTHKIYGNSINLYEHLTRQIDRFEYDIVLIAAGSLAIPLAIHIKQQKKVAISLGGHLQALFGILGDRWARDPEWQALYINEHWRRLPDSLVPNNANKLADEKSYW